MKRGIVMAALVLAAAVLLSVDGASSLGLAAARSLGDFITGGAGRPVGAQNHEK